MSEDRTQLASGGEEHLAALHSGFRLGRYELQAVLGHGGFGITYRAWDGELDRAVAIKEYLPSDISIRVDGSTVKAKSGGDRESFLWGLDRFIAEARALARFERSGAIVRVYDYLQANGTAYMVMALVEGEPLSALYRREAPLSEERLKAIVLPVLEGLEDVHRAGFLHRDIKPSNILIRPGGEPVLIDFGAARQALGEKSRSITSVFTPGYAPFEQYTSSGRQGPWTDIYALAATLYHGVTGRIPPQATDRIREDGMEPAIRAGAGRYSDSFLAAIDAGLQVFEDRRPQTLAQWRAMLTGATATVAPASLAPSAPPSAAAAPTTQPPISQSVTPASIAPASVAPAPSPRRLLPWIAAGVLVLAVGAGAAVTLLSPGSGDDQAVAETAQARAERLRLEAQRAGEEARKAQEAAEAELRRQAAQEAQQIAAEKARREAEAAAARQAEQAKAAAETAQRAGDAAAAQRAEQEARQAAQAEAAQRLAAEQAEKDRKALELARQKAEAELAEARRAAEEARRLTEELRAQAESARRSAAAERQRLEAEARQKAEAEAKAKAKAEADAKAKEEAEARRKAESDTRTRAEEEARRKAEAARENAEAARQAAAESRARAAAARGEPSPSTQQQAAVPPPSAPVDPKDYVAQHWQNMRPAVDAEVRRQLERNSERLQSVDGYDVVEVTAARIRLRVYVSAAATWYGSITNQRTLNIAIGNTPPRFGATGAPPLPPPAASPPSPPPQQQQAAVPGYEFAGTWHLALNCTTVMRQSLPAIAFAITGPSFAARFGADGQASGQIADGRLALKLSYTSGAGESIRGELSLSARSGGGSFSGGGLLTGFAANSMGVVGGPDRQCTATLAK